jgi:hypothetical protein
MSVDVVLERKKLVAFLTKYDAPKVGLADELLKKFAAEGKPGITKMWQSLFKRYNVQPPAGANADGPQPVASPLSGVTAKTPPAAAASPKAPAAASTSKAPVASPKTPASKKVVAGPKDASPKKGKGSAAAEAEQTPTASPKRKASLKVPADASAPAEQTLTVQTSEDQTENQRARLQRYFAKHMPDKMGQVDTVVARISATDKNGEAWANMWNAFIKRFGPEDEAPQNGVPLRSKEVAASPRSSVVRAAAPAAEDTVGSDGLSPLTNTRRSAKTDTLEGSSSGPFSPSQVDSDLNGEGSMTIKSDVRRRQASDNAIREEWVQRISRYLSHYDAGKPDDEIRTALTSAESSPDGMQQLWETLLEHYGPEPPQPISTMLRVMENDQKRKTPKEVAQSLIFGGPAPPDSNQTGGMDSQRGEKRGASKSTDVVGAPASLMSEPKKKTPWYLQDEDVGGIAAASATSAVFKDAARTGNLAFNSNQDDINLVPPNALAIFGVLRLIGIQYDLFRRASSAAQHQFIRSIEQEISFNVDCDPTAVTVRRLIPNVAVDFKIDMSSAVASGNKDHRTAQRIGDILVNRVLNGTFTLRLIRDSYRRDLGGVALDVFTQSCAVFGSESQQYYTLVPDEYSGSGDTLQRATVTGGALADSNYAAVAAAPISRDMNRNDYFGTSPSPLRQTRGSGGNHPMRGPSDSALEKFASNVQRISELDRVGGGGDAALRDETERWLAGVRPPQQRQQQQQKGFDYSGGATAGPRQSHRIGNGIHGDFTSRMWDDTVSELPEYQRREETAQYDLEKPEAINSQFAWNRVLSGFSDPALSRGTNQQGLQYVSFNPRLHTGGGTASAVYSPMPKPKTPRTNAERRLSEMELRGLKQIQGSLSPKRGVFGGGSSPKYNSTGTRLQASPTGRSSPLASSPTRDPVYHQNNKGDSPRTTSRSVGSPLRAAAAVRGASGPTSLVEPPVASWSYEDGEAPLRGYRGFGHSVPAIRKQAESFLTSSNRRTDPSLMQRIDYDGNYMEREGRRIRGVDATTPAGYMSAFTSNVNGDRGALPSSDTFSREYNNIVRAS